MALAKKQIARKSSTGGKRVAGKTKSSRAPSVVEQTPKMIYRNLGRSGLKVSVLALGGWITYGSTVNDDLAFECMKTAYDAGMNFFDCAEGYGNGQCEITMGKAIKKFGWKRNDIVIATKIYWGRGFGERDANNYGCSRKHLIEGTAAALERLQLDYVDLLYCHRPDRTTPIEESVRAMNYLINAGKALYWGTSEWNAEEIAIAHQVADRLGLIGPVMEQPHYNLLHRKTVEKDYLMLYKHYGLGLTTFSPLQTGILTGKYSKEIPADSRYSQPGVKYSHALLEKEGEEWVREVAQAKSLEPVAEKLGTDMATLALAWVISNPNVSCAITGASKPEQVTKSTKAISLLPKITEEVKKEIDDILGNKPDGLIMEF